MYSKILNAEQTRKLDKRIREVEELSSWELMERAAMTFCQFFSYFMSNQEQGVSVLCGVGNNGGDGLAIARILKQTGYRNVKIFVLPVSEEESEDFKKNKYMAGDFFKKIVTVKSVKDISSIDENDIIIDAVMGTGLNRPLSGKWREILRAASDIGIFRLSIDVPSGLYADTYTEFPAFSPDFIFSFQTDKLAFFMPENGDYAEKWMSELLYEDRGILNEFKTNNYTIELDGANELLKSRKKNDHKGTFGHALMIAGSFGKVGAASLSARAALRSGAGLVTVHAPRCAYQILQISFPEAMVETDGHEYVWSENYDLEKYKAIGIGPGIGTNDLTVNAFKELLEKYDKPLVLDADALNILSENDKLFDLVPKNSILTPHPKEAERLFGEFENSFERLEKLRAIAVAKKFFILLKGANSVVLTPQGKAIFNKTGNPGMATAGSGDVLTGIITGLLAQGYSAEEAAVLGMYIHGLAGDIASNDMEHESLIAGDILNYLGKAFKSVRTLDNPIDVPFDLEQFGDWLDSPFLDMDDEDDDF